MASWVAGLLTVLALVMFWRWLLLGLGLMGASVATGLLVERLRVRRLAADGPSAPARALSRSRHAIGEVVTARPRQALEVFGRAAGDRP